MLGMTVSTHPCVTMVSLTKSQLLPISLGIALPKYTIKHHKTLGLQPHIESYKTPTSKYLELVGHGHKGHIPCQSTPQTATKVSQMITKPYGRHKRHKTRQIMPISVINVIKPLVDNTAKIHKTRDHVIKSYILGKKCHIMPSL